MAVINITSIPWDLTLQIDGTSYATRRPTLEELQVMEELAEGFASAAEVKMSQAAQPLRNLLAAFVDDRAAVNAMAWDDMVAAFVACQTYLRAWLKKKRDQASIAATQAITGKTPSA